MLAYRRWEAIFDVPTKEARLKELELRSGAGTFWDNPEQAQTTLKERAQLASQVDRYTQIKKNLEDAVVFLELYQESNDQALLGECAGELEKVAKELRSFELTRMLSEEHDAFDAIVDINAGSGGTEAQDWGEMLLRMYLRWAERSGYAAELVNILAGEGAGIKNATVLIKGPNAYGFLRSERGVHRLVRISPFDSNARRHTSFASVSVVPDIDQTIDIQVRDEDLRVDTYRSSGAGGQHVNKTDSAVRLTHLPSGIVVACQNERSQHKNKATAMKLLKAKLYELEVAKKKEEMNKIAGERKQIDFGSQIRSYVMQPYQMVKDERTGLKSGDIQAVLDGDLEAFMEAYLLSEEKQN